MQLNYPTDEATMLKMDAIADGAMEAYGERVRGGEAFSWEAAWGIGAGHRIAAAAKDMGRGTVPARFYGERTWQVLKDYEELAPYFCDKALKRIEEVFVVDKRHAAFLLENQVVYAKERKAEAEREAERNARTIEADAAEAKYQAEKRAKRQAASFTAEPLVERKLVEKKDDDGDLADLMAGVGKRKGKR